MANYLDLRKQREANANLGNPGTQQPNNAVQQAQQTMQAAMMPVTTAMTGAAPAQPIVLNQMGQQLMPYIDPFGRMAYANPSQFNAQTNQVTPNPKVTVPTAQRPNAPTQEQPQQNNVTVQTQAQGGGTFTRNVNDSNEQDRVGNKSISEMSKPEVYDTMQQMATMQNIATHPAAKIASGILTVFGMPAGGIRTFAANMPDFAMQQFNDKYGTKFGDIQDFTKLAADLRNQALGRAQTAEQAKESAISGAQELDRVGRGSEREMQDLFGGTVAGTPSFDNTAAASYGRADTPYGMNSDAAINAAFGGSNERDLQEQARQDIADRPDIFGGGESSSNQNESDRGNGTGGPDRESAQGARGL